MNEEKSAAIKKSSHLLGEVLISETIGVPLLLIDVGYLPNGKFYVCARDKVGVEDEEGLWYYFKATSIVEKQLLERPFSPTWAVIHRRRSKAGYKYYVLSFAETIHDSRWNPATVGDQPLTPVTEKLCKSNQNQSP
jgi:hypothetical protein